MYMPSACPRSTTLVSPVAISTSGRLGGLGDRLDLGPELIGRQALLEDQGEAERLRLAPATARSFAVPFTASSPIEPPGKRIGRTT